MKQVPWALMTAWGAAILGGIGVTLYSTLSADDKARYDELVEHTARDLYGRAASQLTSAQARHVEVIAREDFAA